MARRLLSLPFLLVACTSPTTGQSPASRATGPTSPFAECTALELGSIPAADVALVIDASESTGDATGRDINGNGKIGKMHFRSRTRPSLGVVSTDPGDTMLAAQVAASEALVEVLASRDLRFAIIVYSWVTQKSWDGAPRDVDAAVEAQLTSEAPLLRSALARILEGGSLGGSKFSPGMAAATKALAGSDRRRRVLFMADIPTPFLPGDIEFDSEMKTQALAAIDSKVVFHTFGLGDAANSPPPHALSRIAAVTGGSFVAVSDPARLHCDLARSLSERP